MSNPQIIDTSPTWQGPDKTVFNPFIIHTVPYKTLNNHPIETAILVPKSLPRGHHPILINMHGGFLTMGHALFAPFFAPWLANLITSNNAICLSIDYRLLPTARGVHDIIDDLDDFWAFFKRDFPGVLSELVGPGHDVDFGRVMLTGGSAGGYCVLQTALSHPDEISAVALMYPMMDLKDDMFVKGPAEGASTVLNFPREVMMSEVDAREWAKGEREKKEWKSRAGFEVTLKCVSLTQCGRFYDEVLNPLGSEDVGIFPLERIREGARAPGKM
ncbi:alpha/beta-hydrolase [Periconia macrospinosa]|uniref:Alpha/beta-hydrolase n=1 Tax=Periconia macrospinosa TaxID=97972 RepID=A0A2V1D4R4_9PLEO|nr:alpha/beta-hydrolase [Periconia macrospinosa]